MNQNVNAELASLKKMTVVQLRGKHVELFGEPTKSGNRDFLFKRLAWRVQALAEGDMTERLQRIRARAAELARDADIRTTAPRMPRPRIESASVGESHRVLPSPPPNPDSKDPRLPPPGSLLTRQYRGQTVEVTVLPKGFEWEGNVYRSLSAVAKAVTGSHWNGHLFFGLRDGATKP